MERDNSVKKGFIPLDKSWMIRIGVLDLMHEREGETIKILERESVLGDDLEALLRALSVWRTEDIIDVGESGTLYRFLQFLSWKENLNKKFIKRGTLAVRSMCSDPSIIHWSLSKLLILDNSTSQWASAAVLCGNSETIQDPPYKLVLTYEAVKCWDECWAKSVECEARYDQTILEQAETFLKLLKGEHPEFIPKQAEDYPFARTFNYIDAVGGERRWPNLRGHESDRIKEVEQELIRYKNSEPIESRDHRVVQALAMRARVDKKEIKILYPEAVKKSWPQFWSFLSNA
ncbi:MAG: hypothetical protein AAB783_00810 [Patescibacteria group bacterium]